MRIVPAIYTTQAAELPLLPPLVRGRQAFEILRTATRYHPECAAAVAELLERKLVEGPPLSDRAAEAIAGLVELDMELRGAAPAATL